VLQAHGIPVPQPLFLDEHCTVPGSPGIVTRWLLLGLDAAATAFLETYEAQAGRPVAKLALWALAAATRAMPDPARVRFFSALGAVHWTAEAMRHALKRFIDAALSRGLEEERKGVSRPSRTQLI
jgi:hypothetical protein